MAIGLRGGSNVLLQFFLPNVYSGSVRILVVEDEVRLAAHLVRSLEHNGHDARVVHDGKVALVGARESYDLLVLDVELPRMDGQEVQKQLRALGVKSRVLMLTARGETPADRETGVGATARYDTKLADVFIGRLRKKKIDAREGEPLIETVRHLGYTLHGNS